VIANQRARIHGAMVEAVAANGYEATSVRELVALAGVSRRSFYEQFANKQECFLVTIDLLAGGWVRRMTSAYRASEGDLEERMSVAFGALADGVSNYRKATRLVVVDAQTAGAEGLMRVRRTMSSAEHMLASSFARAPQASPLPRPVSRAMAGGLHAAMASHLREGGPEEVPQVAQQMLSWTLQFQTVKAEPMAARLAERARAGVRTGQVAPAGPGGPGVRAPPRADRERLLHGALWLAVVEDYCDLTVPQITAATAVSIEAFFELFEGRDECYLAALEMVGGELMEVIAQAIALSGDWPRGVRNAIGALMRFLAERPLYARTVAETAFTAGPRALERNLELARMIALALTEGAPPGSRSGLAVEAVTGAVWYTVHCQVAAERIGLLPLLADHLTYVVLAPFIGAEAAAETVTEPQQRRAGLQ
jgi:AcrR family transcriptional regulator